MIWLIRHGEAAAGWGEAEDPGLSDTGRAQAEAVAGWLAEQGLRHIRTSPMRRCRETAAALESVTGLSAIVEPAISEIETPAGLSDRTAWLKTVMGGRWDEAEHDFTAWRHAALAAIESLPEATAVFTHFIALNAIVGLVEARSEVVVFRPGNASITTVRKRSGRLEIVRKGDEAASRVL